MLLLLPGITVTSQLVIPEVNTYRKRLGGTCGRKLMSPVLIRNITPAANWTAMSGIRTEQRT